MLFGVKFQLIPKRVKVVPEIGAIKTEMSDAFNILFTNDTIFILELWNASVDTKLAHKPHLNVKSTDSV